MSRRGEEWPSEWPEETTSMKAFPGIVGLPASGADSLAGPPGTLSTSRPHEVAPPPHTAPLRSRFEFRCWPSAKQASAIDNFLLGWHAQDKDTRTDIYVLWLRASRFLPKLRGESELEIKYRLAAHDRIEHWALAASCTFPLSDGLKAWLEQEGKFGPCMSGLWGETVHGFLCQAAIEPEWQAIEVRKTRRTFACGPLRAERTDIVCNGQDYVCAAVESDDLSALADTIARRPFAGLANRNYGNFLRGIMGR